MLRERPDYLSTPSVENGTKKPLPHGKAVKDCAIKRCRKKVSQTWVIGWSLDTYTKLQF